MACDPVAPPLEPQRIHHGAPAHSPWGPRARALTVTGGGSAPHTWQNERAGRSDAVQESPRRAPAAQGRPPLARRQCHPPKCRGPTDVSASTGKLDPLSGRVWKQQNGLLWQSAQEIPFWERWFWRLRGRWFSRAQSAPPNASQFRGKAVDAFAYCERTGRLWGLNSGGSQMRVRIGDVHYNAAL